MSNTNAARSADCRDPVHRKKGYCDECEGCRKCPPPTQCSGYDHIPRVKRTSETSPRQGRPRKRSKLQTTSPRLAKELALQRVQESIEVENQNDSDIEDLDLEIGTIETISLEALFEFFGMASDKIHAVKIDEANEKTVATWGKLVEDMLEKILRLCVIGNTHTLKSELVRYTIVCVMVY